MDWLIGHLVGDYLLQNDWMALNKKKVAIGDEMEAMLLGAVPSLPSTFPCAVHCLIWALAVWGCQAASKPWPLWTLPILFLTHFAQDRTELVAWWMRNKGQAGFLQFLAPWSVIVVDNVLHLFVLWIVSHLVQ